MLTAAPAAGTNVMTIIEGASRVGRGFFGQFQKISMAQSSWSHNMKTTGAAMHGMAQQASGLTASLGQLGLGLLATMGIFKAFRKVTAVTLLAGRVEVLDVVVKKVGETAGYSARQIDTVVESVMAMGITMQASRVATTRMIWAQLDLAKATELARVAQDAAVIANINSSYTLQQLIYGIVTYNPRILRTYGIMINMEQAIGKFARQMGISTEQVVVAQKQQIALNEVLSFAERITGAYETSMTKAGKQWVSLPRYMEEMQRTIGEAFLPAFSRLVLAWTKWAEAVRTSEEGQRAFRVFGEMVYQIMGKVIPIIEYFGKRWAYILYFVVAGTTVKAISLLLRGFKSLIAMLFATRFAFASQIQAALLLSTVLAILPKRLKILAATLATLGIGVLVFAKWVMAARAQLALLAHQAVATSLALTGMTIALSSVSWVGIILAFVGVIAAFLLPSLTKWGKKTKALTQDTIEFEDRIKQLKKSQLDEARQVANVVKRYTELYLLHKEGLTSLENVEKAFKNVKNIAPELVGGIDDIDEAYHRLLATLENELLPKLRELDRLQTQIALNDVLLTYIPKVDKKLEDLTKTTEESSKVNVDYWIGVSKAATAAIATEDDLLSRGRITLEQYKERTEVERKRQREAGEAISIWRGYYGIVIEEQNRLNDLLERGPRQGPGAAEDFVKEIGDVAHASQKRIENLASLTFRNYEQFVDKVVGKGAEFDIGALKKNATLNKMIKDRIDAFRQTVTQAKARASLEQKSVELTDRLNFATQKQLGLKKIETDFETQLTKGEKQRRVDAEHRLALAQASLIANKYERDIAIEIANEVRDTASLKLEEEAIQGRIDDLSGEQVKDEIRTNELSATKNALIAKRALLEAQTAAAIAAIRQKELEATGATADKEAQIHEQLLRARAKVSLEALDVWETYLRDTVAGLEAIEGPTEAQLLQLEQYRALLVSITEERRRLLDLEMEAWIKENYWRGVLVQGYQNISDMIQWTYYDMMDSFADLEMEGSERLERILDTMRRAYMKFLADLLRDWAINVAKRMGLEAALGFGKGAAGAAQRGGPNLLGILALLGGLLFLQRGGPTGHGGRSEVAGVVHKREWVVPEEGTRWQMNRELLQLMTQGYNIGPMILGAIQSAYGARTVALPTGFIPDHFYTKRMERLAERTEENTRQPIELNVEMGVDSRGLYATAEEGKAETRMTEI